MDWSQYTIYLPTLMLVIARAAGVFLVAPVFSNSAVPVKLRVFMSVAVGLAVVSRLGEPVALPAGGGELVIGLGCEAAIGATIGYAARLIFSGVELGASHIGQQMGVSLGEAFNPLAEEGGVVRRAYRILALVIFLAIGGHRMLIAAVMRTFQAVPLMGFAPTSAMLNTVVALLGASFVLALKVAAPVLAAMLLATVAMGLLQRTLPSCHILSVGLPIRVMLALAVIAVTLRFLPGLIERAWWFTSQQISALFGAVT